MAVIENFDDVSDWNTIVDDGTITYVASPAVVPNATKMVSSNVIVREKTFDKDEYGIYIQVESTAINVSAWALIKDAADHNIGGIYFMDDAEIHVYDNGVLGDTGFTYSADTWYWFGFHKIDATHYSVVIYNEAKTIKLYSSGSLVCQYEWNGTDYQIGTEGGQTGYFDELTDEGTVPPTKTFTADACLQATFTKTFTADTCLQDTFTKTFTADACLQDTFTKTFTADTLLVSRKTKTFTVDGFLKASGLTKTFTADALLQDTFTKTFTADTLLQDTFTKTFTADALLQDTFTKTFTTDVLLQNQGLTKTFTVDGFLEAQGLTKTFTADTCLQATFAKTFTVDSCLKGTLTKTFTVDVVLISATLAGLQTDFATVIADDFFDTQKQTDFANVIGEIPMSENVTWTRTTLTKDEFGRASASSETISETISILIQPITEKDKDIMVAGIAITGHMKAYVKHSYDLSGGGSSTPKVGDNLERTDGQLYEVETIIGKYAGSNIEVFRKLVLRQIDND